MEAKDQVIYNLQQERKLLKMENQYLREQIQRFLRNIFNFSDKTKSELYIICFTPIFKRLLVI